MKLVITADVHLHPYRICSKDGGFDRLNDGLSVLRQSLDLARQHSAAWVMAGDFKQPKTFWPQEALTGSHAILREYDDIDKLMLAGNHDAEGLGGSGLAPFRDCAEVVEKVKYVYIDGVRVLCAPWNADRAEVAALSRKHGPLPLIAHGFLRGVMVGPDQMHPDEGIPLEEYGDFSVAFFGDIHKGQWKYRRNDHPLGGGWQPLVLDTSTDSPYWVRRGAKWDREVFYPGSPYQQNWGERNDGPKGALLADLDSGDVHFYEFKAPRFRQEEWDEQALDGALAIGFEAWAGDFVRIIYTGPPTAELDNLNEWRDTFRSFQVITRRAPTKAQVRAELHAGLTKPELLKRYMAARPLPEGVDVDAALRAGVRLAQ